MKKKRAPVVYAGRAERFLAYLIDVILLIGAGELLARLMGGGTITLLANFLFQAFYYTHFTASHWQATPGQRITGLHVVRIDRKPLRIPDALERFLVFLFPILPLYVSFIPLDIVRVLCTWLVMVWFLPILFTEQRIGMHDRICGQRVVAGKKK